MFPIRSNKVSSKPGRTAAIAAMTLITLSTTLAFTNADSPLSAKKAEAVARAAAYLQANQAEDGSFTANAGPGVTAIVLTGLLRNGRTVDDPVVAKGLGYLQKFVQPDGGIYRPEANHKNYETCLAILCYSAANKDGRFDKLLEGAEKFIRAEQWDEGEGIDPSHVNYGGSGYGGKKRPDLSNSTFLIDALKARGKGADDEAIKKALIFVSRCQNLESEHNTTPHPAKNPDGGFYYTAAGDGDSMAGRTENGGLRSYASMTYAGLMSMIHAGVNEKDPRVKAAIEWIKKNYTLDSNPGMGDAGLYYYYHTYAKALAAMKQDVFVDQDGKKHEWKVELAETLLQRQRKDGSWLNDNSRWLEGDGNLVTAYALMALAYTN